jgi:hypothetical protein
MAAISTMIMAAAAVVGAASTAVAYQNGQKQEKAAKQAMQQAQDNADKQAKAADEAMNKADQKRPNVQGILASAEQAGKAGASGTMLTGPQGVSPDLLNLGKNTLLGQ